MFGRNRNKKTKRNGKTRTLYPVTESDFPEDTKFNVDPTLESKHREYGLTDDGEPFSKNKNKFSLRKGVKKYTKLKPQQNRVHTRNKKGDVYSANLNEISENNRYVEEDDNPPKRRRRRRPFMR